ncbi:hypothetical protein [Dactylosporangium cerinum]
MPTAVGPSSPDSAAASASATNSAPCAGSPSRPAGAAIPEIRRVRTPVRLVTVTSAPAVSPARVARSASRTASPGPGGLPLRMVYGVSPADAQP